MTPTEIESEVCSHTAMCHQRDGRYRKSPAVSVAVHREFAPVDRELGNARCIDAQSRSHRKLARPRLGQGLRQIALDACEIARERNRPRAVVSTMARGRALHGAGPRKLTVHVLRDVALA